MRPLRFQLRFKVLKGTKEPDIKKKAKTKQRKPCKTELSLFNFSKQIYWSFVLCDTAKSWSINFYKCNYSQKKQCSNWVHWTLWHVKAGVTWKLGSRELNSKEGGEKASLKIIFLLFSLEHTFPSRRITSPKLSLHNFLRNVILWPWPTVHSLFSLPPPSFLSWPREHVNQSMKKWVEATGCRETGCVSVTCPPPSCSSKHLLFHGALLLLCGEGQITQVHGTIITTTVCKPCVLITIP